MQPHPDHLSHNTIFRFIVALSPNKVHCSKWSYVHVHCPCLFSIILSLVKSIYDTVTMLPKKEKKMLSSLTIHPFIHNTYVRTTYKPTYPYIQHIHKKENYNSIWYCFYLVSLLNLRLLLQKEEIPWQYVTNHRQLLHPDWKSLQFSSYPADKAITNKNNLCRCEWKMYSA